MDGGEVRRRSRGLLLVGAALVALLLFAWAAADRPAPSPASAPPETVAAVALAPDVPAGGPAAGPPDDRVANAPPLPAGVQAGETSELLIFLQPGADPLVYATEHGLVYRHTLRSDRDAHVFAAADTTTAHAHLGRARTSVRVRRAYPN